MSGGVVAIEEAPTSGIGKLISENRFFVPTHQRDYRWEKEKVEQLFDDLHDAMARKDKFYFIGMMVFIRDEAGMLRVLDGQQRLATSMIILSAIRSWFSSNMAPDDKDDSKIQEAFIGGADFGETAITPKLTLNFNNRDVFQEHVIGPTNVGKLKSARAGLSKHAPNYDLLSAIIYSHERIQKIDDGLADIEKTKAHLHNLVKFIRDNVIVVRLTVPNEANAFRVFETLNDRGLDLSAIDLLKNYLFGLAHDESPMALRQIEGRWGQITHTLTSLKQDDFIKTFWTSRRGRKQLDDIYEDVKDVCKSSAQATSLSIDLLAAAENFAALDVPDDPVWAPHTTKTRAAVGTLKMLGAKQARPVIMAALTAQLDPKQMERLLRMIEVIIVRYQLIGGERTGALEIQFAKLAPMISSGQITKATEAFAVVKSLYPSDDAFKDAFRRADSIANQKAKYLLKELEAHARTTCEGASGRELGPLDSLTVEHILPRNPSQEWNIETQADPSLVSECAQRLGNLCLLSERANRNLGRDYITTKTTTYAESGLLTTKSLASETSWNRQSIDHRQSAMASNAAQIWRFA